VSPPAVRSRLRAAISVTATVLSLLLVWAALAAPDQLQLLRPSRFLRLPLEAIVLVAVVAVLPVAAGRLVSVLLGVGLGVLAVVSILDMGFVAALGRPFDPLSDWGYFDSASALLRQSVGAGPAHAFVVAAAVAVVALLVLVPLAVLRLTGVVARHRRTSGRTAAGLAVAWALCAATGLQLIPGTPVAARAAAGSVYDHVAQVTSEIQDRQTFVRAAQSDPFAHVPDADLLTALRGKDVIIAFVESYGRVAVDGSPAAASVESTLDAGTAELQAAGFASRSAYLTSPTFGGISWLAHATLQSGLWIDNQHRYDSLMDTGRLTLADAFRRAGWRTVADVPSNQQPWPEGSSFYRYDTVYGAGDVGYAGPPFSYATMPDQYVLAAFQRLELARARRPPVMAEIDLVSSHTPWAPLPRLVPWADVGDGSVFDTMPAAGPSPAVVWRDPRSVRAAYQQSIDYSLRALISFVQQVPDDNLVLVLLGDHQPATIVSGSGASHDVPVSIVAHDPEVMDRVSSWGWQRGLRPDVGAPVWRMDEFRDRFLSAFGAHPGVPGRASNPVAR
jgi:hypothetical protein